MGNIIDLIAGPSDHHKNIIEQRTGDQQIDILRSIDDKLDKILQALLVLSNNHYNFEKHKSQNGDDND